MHIFCLSPPALMELKYIWYHLSNVGGTAGGEEGGCRTEVRLCHGAERLFY